MNVRAYLIIIVWNAVKDFLKCTRSGGYG